MDKISSETMERIRKLSEEIAGKHESDAELRREVQTHIVDKLLGYLEGEERLTEEDAFVLARERLGDQAVLREVLAETHHSVAADSLFHRLLPSGDLVRRVVAFLLVLLSLQVVLVFPGLPLRATLTGEYLYAVCHQWVVVALAVLVLRCWLRRERDGGEMWYLRWRPLYFLGAFLLVAPLHRIAFQVADILGRRLGVPEWSYFEIPALGIFATATGVSASAATLLLLFWWNRLRPRQTGAALTAAVLLLLLQLSLPLASPIALVEGGGYPNFTLLSLPMDLQVTIIDYRSMLSLFASHAQFMMGPWLLLYLVPVVLYRLLPEKNWQRPDIALH